MRRLHWLRQDNITQPSIRSLWRKRRWVGRSRGGKAKGMTLITLNLILRKYELEMEMHVPKVDSHLYCFHHTSAWQQLYFTRSNVSNKRVGKHAFPQPYTNWTECLEGMLSHRTAPCLSSPSISRPLWEILSLKNRRFVHSFTWDGSWMA